MTDKQKEALEKAIMVMDWFLDPDFKAPIPLPGVEKVRKLCEDALEES